MDDKAPIDFYFDFSSPYGYLLSERIDDLAARFGRKVRWHPILLGVVFQATGSAPLTLQSPAKGEYSLHDFERSARFAGVPLKNPDKFPIPTQNAARVFWWLADQGGDRATQWARNCLRAYFARGVDLSDPQQLRQLAEDFGIGADAAESVWNDAAWKLRLKQENEAAIAAGVFGAPFFMVDGEPFWGNDRQPQIERWLASGPF